MVLMWTGNEFQAVGPATVNELSAKRNFHVLMIGDAGRCSDCTDQSDTQAPCHGRRRTLGRITYTLYAWQPVASVTGAAMV